MFNIFVQISTKRKKRKFNLRIHQENQLKEFKFSFFQVYF